MRHLLHRIFALFYIVVNLIQKYFAIFVIFANGTGMGSVI